MSSGPEPGRPSEEGGRSYEDDCAICFESVSQTTTLPCACNVSYCTRCWDRALAQSYTFCGQARCPTCRSPVRVDFEPESGRLLFSREAPIEAGSEEAVMEAMRVAQHRTTSRLLDQARPAQKRILERHGAANPALREFAQDPWGQLRALPEPELRGFAAAAAEGGDLVGEDSEGLIGVLQATLGSASALASFWAASHKKLPACVCGSSLKRISGAQRVSQVVSLELPGYPPDSDTWQQVFQYFMLPGNSGVICDLCGKGFQQSGSVWTCTNGRTTILHATEYDVCDNCFARHVCGLVLPDDDPAAAVPPTAVVAGGQTGPPSDGAQQ